MTQRIIDEIYGSKSTWAKRLWELLALVVIAGALFGWGAWVGYKAHPATKTIKITGNPTQAKENKADFVVEQKNEGEFHSDVTMTPMTPIGDTVNNHSLIGFQKSPWEVSQGLFDTVDELTPGGWTGRGELTGEVKTTIIDKRSKAVLWTGKTDLKGQVDATMFDGQLAIDGTTYNDLTLAMDLPELKPKRWEVGAVTGIATDGDWFYGGYGRYNVATLNIGRFEASPWIGVAGLQTNNGMEGMAMAGISGRF
jgi:hypothetical protein